MPNNREKEAVNSKSIQVSDQLTVNVLPSSEHEFLMSSKDVALGYGTSVESIRGHKSSHARSGELKEGVHFISSVSTGVCISNAGKLKRETTMWTKAGVVRLGFFIRSERAVMFRDWAEKTVLVALSSPAPKALPDAVKRKHNRLTQERMVSILSDVALIENKQLRERLVAKLKGGNHD